MNGNRLVGAGGCQRPQKGLGQAEAAIAAIGAELDLETVRNFLRAEIDV